MAQILINKGGHTVATIKAAISTLGTCKVWQGGDITRIYFGQVYAQIVEDTIVIGNKLKASTGLSQVANVIQAADAAVIEPTQPVVSERKAQRWDNLYNEGCSDNYNPYRTAEMYRSSREMARHMAAEGGDR